MDKEKDLTELMNLLDDVCRESRKILHQSLVIGIGRTVNRMEEIEQSYGEAREAVSYGGIAGDVVYINDVEPARTSILWLGDKEETALNHALRFGEEENIISCVENIARPMKKQGEGAQSYLIGILNVILRVVQKNELEEQLIFGKYSDYNGVLQGITTAEELSDSAPG